jgi:hypothetical protein
MSYDGGPEGIRTLDLCDANAALSQLSHEPTFFQIAHLSLFIITLSARLAKPKSGKSHAIFCQSLCA